MGAPAVTDNDRAAAEQLLARTDELRTRVRARTGGAWAVLLGFGLLALAAVPIARHAFNFGADGRDVSVYPVFAYAELTELCVTHAPEAPCSSQEFDGSVLKFVYWGIWFAVLPLAWAAAARWYRLRGESRGIVPRRTTWLFAVGGATVVVLAALAGLLLVRNQHRVMDILENGYASPWYLVGVGLLALGLVERSWITAAAGVAHSALLAAYVAADPGTGLLPWVHEPQPGWADGPQVKALLLAAVLLAAAFARRTADRRLDAPAASSTVAP
ncbi:hypothetical protein F4556_007125 [Kitasatospora gansuensis]|uniref:Uncharacterized protein n=1 Tax=Kitasatospora gansuensis TaxID=258050 RepID=A0A7W7SJI4_9ACTN|nr:hypothetical protein [Kitasatospora gansuensis]MBB4951590.1 hypothetical protein [Kitasatospora gansuensis]